MKTNTFKTTALSLCVVGALSLGACASDPYYSDSRSADRSGRVVSDSSYRRGGVCMDCGTVRSITQVNEGGRSTGGGAVLGAIIGGIAGHQVGGGTGQDIATAAGAVGGAIAGNEIEKNRRGDNVVYDVRVRMESGSERVITVADTRGLRPGDEVIVDGNQITVVD